MNNDWLSASHQTYWPPKNSFDGANIWNLLGAMPFMGNMAITLNQITIMLRIHLFLKLAKSYPFIFKDQAFLLWTFFKMFSPFKRLATVRTLPRGNISCKMSNILKVQVVTSCIGICSTESIQYSFNSSVICLESLIFGQFFLTKIAQALTNLLMNSKSCHILRFC